MTYTWEELCESQDFDHGQEFVTFEHWEANALEIKNLEEKLKLATKALEFYADESNWSDEYGSGKNPYPNQAVICDEDLENFTSELDCYANCTAGKTARETLKKLRELL